MRLPSNTYLVSMLLLIAVTTAISADAAVIALGAVVAPVTIVVVLRRVREVRPSRPGIWYGITAVGVILLIGGAVRVVAEPPFPGLPDYIELVAYATAVGSFAILVANRTRLTGRNSMTEALILPGGLAVILWNYVLVPGIRDDVLSTDGQVVNTTFNALSLILCGLIAAMFFGPGRRVAATYLLSLMGLGALIGDVLGTVQTAGGEIPGLDRWIVMVQSLAFLAAGLAARDPSMARITEPTAEPEGTLGGIRLSVMGVAAFTAPLILVARIGHDDPVWVVAGTVLIWIATIAGVLARLGGLIHARERQVDANRVLTVAAEQFMAATSPPSMYTAAIRAASAIAGEAAGHLRTTVLVNEEDTWTIAASTGSETGDPIGTEVRFAAAHDSIVDALMSRRAEQFVSLPAIDYSGVNAPAACIFPLVAAAHLRGALLVTTANPLDAFTTATISSLSTDLSLALEGTARAEAIHREASERRFRALVDKSNDVIALLDDNACIEFIGPAVSRLLGHDEAALLGTPIEDLVFEEDRKLFRASIDGHPSAPSSTEVRLVDLAGRQRWFDIIAADHRHDPNIAGTVVTARDVHGRKAADDRTLKSEARFRSLVQHANDLVIVMTDEGIVSYASPSAERILGFSPEQLQDSMLDDFVADRHRTRLRDAVGRLESRPDVPFQFELDLTTASGETRTLDITARDLRHEPAVEGVVVNARDITERKRLEQSLRHQALHDSLTGIPNRTLFHDRVEQALARRNAEIAVFVIDIDDFKTVNDGLGHHAGDDLLKVLAFRLRQVLRVGDTAARLGGDEFAVLIEDAIDRDKVSEIAQRLLAKIREPFENAGRDLTVEGSIGIAFSADLAQCSAEVLIRGADAAMYAAKAAGKGRSECYEESMHLGAMERLHLKTDLSNALHRDELCLWYQPVVSLRDGSLEGFEALLRWDRPGLGLMNPADFIPIAEETGLIVPIGRWVLHEALDKLAEWQVMLGKPDLTMGVNVSPRQLVDTTLVADIEDALEQSGVGADNVAIELTETSRVDEDSSEADRLAAIRRLGCDVYADDFGAGYATYAALRRLPFSGVKLDRSLIDGVANDGASSARAQVRSMIEMAQHLGLGLVAEGIETPAQVRVLLELGCEIGQGYHFGRPSADGGLLAIDHAPPGHSHTASR